MKKLLTLTLIAITTILVMMASIGEAADPEDASLILSLSFDNAGEEAEDLSQYGNNGTLSGGPEWVDGKFEGALQFDGEDDFVEVPHAEILCVDEEVTVMAWINAERHTGPGGAGWQGILSKSNSPRSYSFYTESGGGLHFSTAGTGSVSSAVPLNEWVHVVAMVVEGSHQYYINGEDAGTGGGGINLPGTSDTATVLVGKTHEGNREFLGLIDEVRIWNRALTQDEVKEEMDMGSQSLAVDASGKLGATWGSIKSMY